MTFYHFLVKNSPYTTVRKSVLGKTVFTTVFTLYQKIDRKKSETTTYEAGNNQLIAPNVEEEGVWSIAEGEALREEEVVGRLEDGGR